MKRTRVRIIKGDRHVGSKLWELVGETKGIYHLKRGKKGMFILKENCLVVPKKE